MHNTTDIQASIKQASEACRVLSGHFLEMGRNRWIEIAIDEGWTHNLREAARSKAFEAWRLQSLTMDRIEQTPSLAEIDSTLGFRSEDHAYFKQYGRDINRVELHAVCKARAARNGKAYPILSSPPSPATESTDDLVRRLKASMIEIEARSTGRHRRHA